MAAYLGYKYTGIDLSDEQIQANIKQAKEIIPVNMPNWIVGDSRDKIPTDKEFDFVFSCPPYHDLEVYSDNKKDLSNMDYDEFFIAYKDIISKTIKQLKNDRFACFVVGDIRNKKGFYKNFVSDTVGAFHEAGATLYNEAILINAIGSLPIRVGRQFAGYRKLGKCHQNILIFFKGNPKTIKDNFPELIEILETEIFYQE